MRILTRNFKVKQGGAKLIPYRGFRKKVRKKSHLPQAKSRGKKTHLKLKAHKKPRKVRTRNLNRKRFLPKTKLRNPRQAANLFHKTDRLLLRKIFPKQKMHGRKKAARMPVLRHRRVRKLQRGIPRKAIRKGIHRLRHKGGRKRILLTEMPPKIPSHEIPQTELSPSLRRGKTKLAGGMQVSIKIPAGSKTMRSAAVSSNANPWTQRKMIRQGILLLQDEAAHLQILRIKIQQMERALNQRMVSPPKIATKRIRQAGIPKMRIPLPQKTRKKILRQAIFRTEMKIQTKANPNKSQSQFRLARSR